MPNLTEIKVEQKRRLHPLVYVQKLIKERDIEGAERELEKIINATETEMEKEDVAYVREQVSKL